MKEMIEVLIAPCGMNCRLCIAKQREKNQCQGCRNVIDIQYKTKGSSSCIIKNCPVIRSNKAGFCFDCHKLPCLRLKLLDKRYRTKYHMSMLENLEHIKQYGMEKFYRMRKLDGPVKNVAILCVSIDLFVWYAKRHISLEYLFS